MSKYLHLAIGLLTASLLLPRSIIHYSEIYCKTHRIKLIHSKIIFYGKKNTPLETGYCPKCHKEYCEYTDISNVYISNYEWLYENNEPEV